MDKNQSILPSTEFCGCGHRQINHGMGMNTSCSAMCRCKEFKPTEQSESPKSEGHISGAPREECPGCQSQDASVQPEGPSRYTIVAEGLSDDEIEDHAEFNYTDAEQSIGFKDGAKWARDLLLSWNCPSCGLQNFRDDNECRDAMCDGKRSIQSFDRAIAPLGPAIKESIRKARGFEPDDFADLDNEEQVEMCVRLHLLACAADVRRKGGP